MFSPPCPNCGYHFGWMERLRASRCLRLARKVVKCPECGAKVIYGKWGWRMSAVGPMLVLLAVVGVPAVNTLGAWHIGEPVSMGLAVLGVLTMYGGAAVSRLELVEAANQTVERTGAQPSGCDSR